MKKIINIILLLCVQYNLFAQPNPIHYSHWIFGNDCAIYFDKDNNFVPSENIPYIFDRFQEGTSSYSDENGNLKYYLHLNETNAILKYPQSAVWTHPSVSDELIKTNSTVSNTGLFIQSLHDSNILYLITPNNPTSSPPFENEGLHYSIIDKTLNNGIGDFTLVNENLYPNTTEKITAVYNEIDNVCWVITHEQNTNNFKIIKIDENGLDENVITQSIGLPHISTRSNINTGRISLSPSGTTLAVTLPFLDLNLDGTFMHEVELLDFDPKTGVLSNPRSLKFDEHNYSTAFSPNGEILYVKAQNKIYQYDLTICDIDEMIASRYTIVTSPSAYYNAIERGPDGVIYCGRENSHGLDAILNPDEIGSACNYREDYLPIGGNFMWGMPTVINSYFTGDYDSPCETVENNINYNISYPEIACFNDSINIIVETDFDAPFTLEFINNQNYLDSVGPFTGSNGIADFNITTKQLTPLYPRLRLELKVEYIGHDINPDTLVLGIHLQNCCQPFIRNWNFRFWNTNNTCYPVDFNTDMKFGNGENLPCPIYFEEYGEIKNTSNPRANSANFLREPTTGRMLAGDPLPNIPQRAWYQNIATKIGGKYRFLASVSNIEEIQRFCEGPFPRHIKLDMWLAIKNRNQEISFTRAEDIKYEDGWITLEGEFIAEDNTTELSIWVLGESEFDCPSSGFGIDYVEIEKLNPSELSTAKDTTICFGDSVLLENQFTGEIFSIQWSPEDWLNNPKSLSPIAIPPTTTLYKLEIQDEYNCVFIDSILVTVDSLCYSECVPDLTIIMNDTTVLVGDNYCISGVIIPECKDTTILKSLEIYLRYDEFLNKVISASTDYDLIRDNESPIIALKFNVNDIKLNEDNHFEVCFVALLGDSNFTSLKVDETINQEKYSIKEKKDSEINFLLCEFPSRRIKLLKATSFEALVDEKSLNIILTSSEIGDFRFIISDINGRIIIDESVSSKREYKSELFTQINLQPLSSGVYNVRMRAPSGKVYTNTIVITN